MKILKKIKYWLLRYKPFYYDCDDYGLCKEECQIKEWSYLIRPEDKKWRIGSVKCQDCENCLGYDVEEWWVKCSSIKKATKHK